MSELMQQEQKWTQEKPTVSGWYWIYDNGLLEVAELELREGSEYTMLYRGGDRDLYRLDGTSFWWQGPIPEPAPPNTA